MTDRATADHDRMCTYGPACPTRKSHIATAFQSESPYIVRVDTRDPATVEKVARKLAEQARDEVAFRPPRMDGITREGTAESVYLRRAEAVLAALEES